MKLKQCNQIKGKAVEPNKTKTLLANKSKKL